MAAMPDRTIVVARRFRGPDTGDGATANGGYFCGLVAGAAPRATTIEIRARAGIPLERPLTVRGDGDAVEVLDGDGLRIFAGPEPGDGPDRGQVRVAGWRPDPAFLDGDGRLRPELVWSALDCPGGWALAGPGNTGTLQVEIREPVDGRRPLIVMGWRADTPTPRAGSRRRHAGTALFDARGRLLAVGAAIWVAPDPLATAR
jgi:hypothetical protein